jgi:putative IMPACT (imprinted ancient) family translation regulator
MDFGFFVKKLREEGKIKLHFETEQELLNLLQDVHVNGFDLGFNSNPASKEISFYKKKVEAVDNFLDAFRIARI